MFKLKVQRGIAAAAALAVIGSMYWIRAGSGQSAAAKPPTRLAVVWSSGDSEVAHKVCFMYTHNAKKQGWFDEVRLVVWGPSSRLLAGDKELQKAIQTMMKDGVHVQACVVCANLYGVTDDLRKMDIEVKGMGKPLSDYLQTDWKVITF